jgi:hypothetical protein
VDFLDILLERVIRSKPNKKAEWVKAYLGYGWFGPQLEKILRLSPLKPNIMLSFLCLSQIRSGFAFGNLGSKYIVDQVGLCCVFHQNLSINKSDIAL